MIRNILYFLGSVILFFVSMLLYGMLQNIGEIPLEKIISEKNVNLDSNINLQIDKKKQKLMLYSDTTFIKSYKIACGRSQSNIKRSSEDYVTPTGEYFVCSIGKSENYYKLFKLSFPNKEDASEALKEGDISKEEYGKIMNSFNSDSCSYYNTQLGANIGIHGIGVYNFIFKNLPFVFNWTNGSISISNESIDEIFPYVKIGTKVIITNSSNSY
ncbi:MAG: L,D-transpeptidase [Bacteroidota bacterium]